MKPISFIPVGHVENEFDEPVQHHLIKSKTSRIVLDKKYKAALLKIELCTYIDIIFHFHASDEYQLVGKTHTGEERGIFASRSQKRPNGIGVTTVKLLELHDNILVVEGLDAIDQTPVLDIKCCDTSCFEKESDNNPVHNQLLKANPRLEVHNLIETGDTRQLLLRAGALHGHFCPGLSMGVMAASHEIGRAHV